MQGARGAEEGATECWEWKVIAKDEKIQGGSGHGS